jgi:hypothetical protein
MVDNTIAGFEALDEKIRKSNRDLREEIRDLRHEVPGAPLLAELRTAQANASVDLPRLPLRSARENQLTPMTKLDAALTAVADALAELPGKELALEWIHGGLLADDVCLIVEDRHPAKAAEMARAFEEWKRSRRERKR